MTFKRQRRIVKYQQEILRCGDDIQALTRFTAAQTEAFRKILKKYKVRYSPVRPLLSRCFLSSNSVFPLMP